jgi:RimJ/RimL family protein N-acetyltransferase
MAEDRNELGQPIGEPVRGWTTRPLPLRTPMAGRTCRVEALDPLRHGATLWEANQLDATKRNMTYLSADVFPDASTYCAWLESMSRTDDPLFYAVVDAKTSRAVGVLSYLRIVPEHGVIEIGHINFSPLLQRTTASTEALFLLMRRAFDELGYRRLEWKCDSLNGPSRAAALRLGFHFEGIFRQAVVYKGRNRDTAWFSITDAEWPAIRDAFEKWLAPANFDAAGVQREALAAMISRAVATRS